MSRSFAARAVAAVVCVVVAGAAVLAWQAHRPKQGDDLQLGVVRQTEVHIAAQRSGRLASVQVVAGQHVRKGDVLALLSSPELTAAVQDAQAAAAQARADRDNVEAGVRQEQIDIAAQGGRIAEANRQLAQQQFQRSKTLSAEDFATKQQLDDDATALDKANAKLELMRSIYAKSTAGPTKEERATAKAKLDLTMAAAASAEAELVKTRITAPTDGTVQLLIAMPGEVISPGQPILTLVDPIHGLWFSFILREDALKGIGIDAPVRLVTASKQWTEGRVTELRPLGEFATWRAARAVGDHDLNSFVVRVDSNKTDRDLRPGMSIWLSRER